jgi:toxin ParE1/3/4
MTRYRLSPKAQADLEEIWTYSVERWGEARATAYLTAIRDLLTGLTTGVAITRSA